MVRGKIKNGLAVKSEVTGAITICPQCGNNANGPGHDNGICFFARREQDIAANLKKKDPTRVNV